jgi:hypothetical protein
LGASAKANESGAGYHYPTPQLTDTNPEKPPLINDGISVIMRAGAAIAVVSEVVSPAQGYRVFAAPCNLPQFAL